MGTHKSDGESDSKIAMDERAVAECKWCKVALRQCGDGPRCVFRGWVHVIEGQRSSHLCPKDISPATYAEPKAS